MTIQQAISSPGCGCYARDTPKTLISIDQALARIATHVAPVGCTEAVTLDRALGRVLAHPVLSLSMAPAFDNAAMDGYAIATGALAGNGPWKLQVVGRVAAGRETKASLAGKRAARIFTGAPIPDGADAVVKQEEVTRDGDVMQLTRRPAAGLNIRRAGSDMAKGAPVLDKGRRLRPRDIAACAAAGAGTVQTRRRLRVALLVTGDELRNPGDLRDPAQIWDVNMPLLTASLAAAGADIVASAHGADSLAGLVRQMGDMAAQADLVITTGGISVGEEDHVKPAFAKLGGETLFSGVAIKPGKPVSAGRIGNTHWLGLPGNPLAAYVTWQVFGMALLRVLGGEAVKGSARRLVVTDAPISRKPGRCELRPATLAGVDAHGREVVSFDDATHSARLGCLPMADGLMFLPANTESLPSGALVEFQPFCQS
ncbi:molybdopterin molybdotransferase MoeA [Lutimaribacter sp. EGI FJ00015]|uniref:Molybdopterin molybdotransferase MoeA n=1 Tax=Lutimaribacter degradans TaxID=2945989 RepID=A0ACC5ZSY3_9RHOB|nr:gephyrin-like molybdotransferase Glp [Lutimaribacter sp. EGI FJ00013]MCM2561255.1 molybdopterin molybdotransferase MoeA [Lutimaribacter sp. EGI FJ00013]MCO0611796.1 molybdopterin molybdotransferase MoeA [Lutimaribacter sp. EGI FJ00015]MCO0635083.1 molybdopterin molybdotransferase MoeA [Lutimaribacter sp. EGI FJ00014]